METAPLKCDIIKNMEIKDEIITANGKTISIPEDTKKHLSAHPDVLEFLEEATASVEQESITALDVGTGSGILAIALAKRDHG